jgi:hypothetical protein
VSEQWQIEVSSGVVVRDDCHSTTEELLTNGSRKRCATVQLCQSAMTAQHANTVLLQHIQNTSSTIYCIAYYIALSAPLAVICDHEFNCYRHAERMKYKSNFSTMLIRLPEVEQSIDSGNVPWAKSVSTNSQHNTEHAAVR